jgi:nickel-dependent lactate racemase
VTLYPPSDGPDIGHEGIVRAFANPIGTPRIQEIARGKKTVAIVIDDLSRPTEGARLLPYVIGELREAGIGPDDVQIILGVANHRQMMREDILKKVGQATLDLVEVKNHFSWYNCEQVGTTGRGTPISLNKDVLAADVKILVGSIVPHGTPGFSGGAKLVVPGIASIDTCQRWHGPEGPSTGLGIDASEARLDAEEAGRLARIDCIVNTVTNSRRQIAGLVVGDLVQAHRAGVRIARQVYGTSVPQGVDVGIFNAFPKDNEFLQIGNCLNVYHSTLPGRPIVHEDGTVVQCSASSEGPGFHSLMGAGMPLDWPGSYAEEVAPRDLIFYAPGVTSRDLNRATRDDPKVTFGLSWSDVVAKLREKHGAHARVAVFPCSSIQLARPD